MFDCDDSMIELSPGESLEEVESADRLAYQVTCRELADGWVEEDRQALPDLGSIPPGPYLSVLVEYVDRSKLNGFDLVRLLQARERLIAHGQAGSMADSVEISYAAPGDFDSDVDRLAEAFHYAADELRPALRLSRRAAEYRLSLASDIVERLPQVWELFSAGSIDAGKARAFSDGTCHVPDETARSVVAQLAGVAPRLTVGQLRARIRRLCLTADPEDATKRERTAHQERRLVIEPTPEGTADLHLFGLRLDDARAIGRRVNGHMISLKKEDRSGRSHDQLRADIARDPLLGGDPSNGGRGLVDIHVPVATLDGGDEPAEIGGLGPVSGENARRIVAGQPDADHQITVIDENGTPTHIYTLSRRATTKIRRHMEALQPTCSFPGCVAPAIDCDYDHASRASLELMEFPAETPTCPTGQASTSNGGPKCDHDHELKDHGWAHKRVNRQDSWSSPLGHTYVTQGQSP
jgi:hypothetical protein